MDKPEIYNGQKGDDLYFINTNNYFPARCNGWYYLPMKEYLLEQNIIQEDDIKYCLLSSISIPHNYYNKFIDFCYKNLDEDIRKLSINSMIGGFKPNLQKRMITQSLCITENHSGAYYIFSRDNASFIEKMYINGKCYYHVYKYEASIKTETETPFHERVR